MDEVIRKNFKSGLRGIINSSGGFKQLFYTMFHFWSIIILLCIVTLYSFNVKTAEHSLNLIDSLIASATSVLGGIVGLSLAGLTLIITFSNPEVIERSVSKQLKDYQKQLAEYEEGNHIKLDPSYFQKAIAKFSFIVLFQVISLIFFFLCGIFRGFVFEINPQIAYWINTVVFGAGIYLMTFSLILVVASILNLFTFSQTSTFLDFMKKLKTQSSNESEQDQDQL